MTDTVGGPTRHLFLPPSPLPAFTGGREQGRLRGTAVTEGRALGRGPGLGSFLCGHPNILNNFPFAFVFYESKSNGTTERAPGDSEPRLTPLTSPRNPLSAAVSPDLFQGAASSELGGSWEVDQPLQLGTWEGSAGVSHAQSQDTAPGHRGVCVKLPEHPRLAANRKRHTPGGQRGRGRRRRERFRPAVWTAVPQTPWPAPAPAPDPPPPGGPPRSDEAAPWNRSGPRSRLADAAPGQLGMFVLLIAGFPG